MKRKNLYWIGGGILALALVCGACVGLGVLVANTTGDGGLAFGDAVAVVRVEGPIVSGDPTQDPFGGGSSAAFSSRIVNHLKQANEDESVKAVVLRVNSPGGGVVASDEIHQQMLKMDKPVVASMGDVAASGGYFVSAPADEIWANPNTLTGSIGVIGQFINIEGFLEEHGIEATAITSGKFKDTGSLFRDMTEEDRALWQAIIDEAYDDFVAIVAEGRDMAEEEVRALADGRVYTGRQAKAAGLVDELGNLPDAIERAAELGGIEGTPRLVEYDEPPTVFEALFGAFQRPTPVEELQSLLHLEVGPNLMYLYTQP
ncbi:MAG: signal peptide peptidase SppA [Anaerolineae bacterium]